MNGTWSQYSVEHAKPENILHNETFQQNIKRMYHHIETHGKI